VTQRTFANRFTLRVHPPTTPSKTHPPSPKPPVPGPKPGPVPDGHGGIDLPPVIRLKRSDPNWGEHFSDDNGCLDLIEDTDEVDGKQQTTYTFYLNVSNLALQTDLKASKSRAAVVMKQFEVGAVLVGLGLIHDQQTNKRTSADENGGKDPEASLRDRVQSFSRAVAPVLVPMIQTLGELGEDDLDESDLAGQAEHTDSEVETDAAL